MRMQRLFLSTITGRILHITTEKQILSLKD